MHHLMTGFTSPGQQHISGKIKHFVRLQPVGMWVGCPNSAHKYQNPIHSKSKEFHWRKEASSFASLEKGLAGLEGRTGQLLQTEVRKGGKKESLDQFSILQNANLTTNEKKNTFLTL